MTELKDVSFSYGEKQVIRHLDLCIGDRDRFLLKGDSGIGKSTLLGLITGLLKPDSGMIRNDFKRVSVCFQDDRLLPFKTVKKNVSFFENQNDPMKILSELGLSDAAGKYPSELSGGMARRCAIARALAYGGDLFIFDEPMNGQDPDNIRNTAETIKKYTKDAALIVISHREEDAALLDLRTVSFSDISK